MHSRFLSFAAFAAVPLLGVGLAAQGKLPRPLPHEVDVKTPRLPDPHKGMGEVVAFTGDPPAAPERRSDIDGPLADQLAAQQPAAPFATVVWSTASDGRTWASGATYKASFGTDGFTYVPFFGADAPRNYPVRFVLRRVEVGGRDLAFDAGPVAPERTGDRVVFRRGPVQEVYDAGPRGVEQSFVVDGALPGDVVVEIDVEGDLVEDESLPGIQFGNALGRVEYGDAFVVDGGRKLPIHSTYAAGSIRLHVPASQRTAAAVVIDPVISTGYAATFPTHDFHNPDVAYDATTQTYLVVWQRNYSAEDIDVFCEVRAADGSFVSGTFGVIDNSSEHWSAPRVANLNAYDRFLVVAERYVATNPAGQRYSIWGRTRDAGAANVIGAPFEVSSSVSGDKRHPDVGGDPHTVTPTYWTVVYTRELTDTDHDIHARQVEANGVPRSGTILLENSANSIHRVPRISSSNGATGASAQRWMVVWSYQFSISDWDVYGASLTWDGNIAQPATPISVSVRSDTQPSVSAPSYAVQGTPCFAVTWVTRQSPYVMFGKVVDANVGGVVPETNLSLMLGLSSVWFPRVESDGVRFVVTYADGAPAYAATLGVVGNSFVVHEPPQSLGNHNAYYHEIVARRSGGGSNTGYAIVFSDRQANPDRIVFALYEGHGAGGVAVRQTGCGGLGITSSGRPVLGEILQVNLTGVGTDLAGALIGLPSGGLPLCPGCLLGVDVSGPLVNLPGLTTMNLPIPAQHVLVGGVLAVQGYALGSGSCLGSLRLGHTLDVTVQ